MAIEKCNLGDVLIFQRGHDLPKSEMISGQYPVMGSNGIIGWHNQYTDDFPCPAITVGRSGSVGNPRIFYGHAWAHNTSLYVKDFKGNDPIFLYYFLKTIPLFHYAGGSAVPTLNRNHIHSIEIMIEKDLGKQQKIGKLLKTFDDKIKINSEINDNLAA